jgi:hypothetical protein
MDETNECELGLVFSLEGGERKYIQNFGGETTVKANTWKIEKEME